MTDLVTDWLPVAVMAVVETAFYATAFLPAFLTAEAIKAARRRQLARLSREASGARAYRHQRSDPVSMALPSGHLRPNGGA